MAYILPLKKSISGCSPAGARARVCGASLHDDMAWTIVSFKVGEFWNIGNINKTSYQ
jgi:hypothetical protein